MKTKLPLVLAMEGIRILLKQAQIECHSIECEICETREDSIGVPLESLPANISNHCELEKNTPLLGVC